MASSRNEKAEQLAATHLKQFARPGTVPNRVFRDTVRRFDYKLLQNEITTALITLYVEYPLLKRDNSFLWMKEFDNFETGFQHPLFRNLIKNKYKESSDSTILDILLHLTFKEVSEFCYGVTTEAAEFITSHVEEIVRKQEVIAVHENSAIVKNLIALDGTTHIDSEYDVGEYLAEGGSLEPEISGVTTIEQIVTDLSARQDCSSSMFDDRREQFSSPMTLTEVKENDVEPYFNRRFKSASLPLVIFAPPASGKTTFNMRTRSCLDTDSIYLWQTLKSNGVYLTNMSSAIAKAVLSVAIIPDRRTFERRCTMRGLVYKNNWYSDMLRNVRKANVKILSNKYLSEQECILSSRFDVDRPPP